MLREQERTPPTTFNNDVIPNLGTMIWDTLAPYKDDLMVYGLGLFALVAGASKFVAPGVWGAYNPDWFLALVPLSTTVWMYLVGVIEAAVGILILIRWKSHVWAGVASLWLLSVTVAVASAGFYDIAWRDFGLVLFALIVSINEYQRSDSGDSTTL